MAKYLDSRTSKFSSVKTLRTCRGPAATAKTMAACARRRGGIGDRSSPIAPSAARAPEPDITGMQLQKKTVPTRQQCTYNTNTRRSYLIKPQYGSSVGPGAYSSSRNSMIKKSFNVAAGHVTRSKTKNTRRKGPKRRFVSSPPRRRDFGLQL